MYLLNFLKFMKIVYICKESIAGLSLASIRYYEPAKLNIGF